MYEKDTDKLFEELKIKPDAKTFLAENADELKTPLHEYLNKLLQEKNLIKSEVVNKVSYDNKYIYNVFSGLKNPSRKTLLAIARAMELTLDETQYLLRYGGYGILYPRDKWDAVIIAAIEKNLSVRDTDELLLKFALPTLIYQKE